MALPVRSSGTSSRLAQAPINARNTGLLMPTVIRKPENPATVPAPFPIPRRHQESWRYFFEPTELVGFAEYSRALNYLDRLLQITSLAEQRVLDDMIAADDRFVVHSSLSSRFDALEPASPLRLANRQPHPKAERSNERRGLGWLMAHARVELEAMRMLGGGTISTSWNTFPAKFEEDAFLELLLDSARQHYYEIVADPTLAIRMVDNTANRQVNPTVTGRPQDFLLLRQLDQKLTLTIGLLRSFQFAAATKLTAAQQQEIDRWVSRLTTQQETQREFLARVVAAQNEFLPRIARPRAIVGGVKEQPARNAASK
jgi:hypothetical protein